ncbi:hypothetical protein [Enterobacter roggenkampii]|uniref:hypothetical protein n=2 Tax=Gammaproteobacteria TaxID=1236 RepID=UPI00201FE05E|nr:hypothetical protein [Enterobacter roggenkampii]MCL8154067.1 hypothetical protein [Enterobacter roggenkampii]MCM7558195.1 hypothetical protein [Enterobacter roggenkampii]
MHSNSKERGMIFNAEMVRAILSGQKTQTRRIVKNVTPDNCMTLTKPIKTRDGVYTHVMDAPKHGLCPHGNVGDLIWVRETHHLDQYGYTYKADGDWVKEMRESGAFGCDEKWTPSMHMKRCASRILLEITNVRVERLNDISNEDAKAEGYPAELAADGGYYDPFLWFRNLWDGIYPEQSFKHNPWVWCISFKRVQEQSND